MTKKTILSLAAALLLSSSAYSSAPSLPEAQEPLSENRPDPVYDAKFIEGLTKLPLDLLNNIGSASKEEDKMVAANPANSKQPYQNLLILRLVCKEWRESWDKSVFTHANEVLQIHRFSPDDLSNTLYEDADWRVHRVRGDQLNKTSTNLFARFLVSMHYPNLRELELIDCEISEIPSSVFRLKTLEKLRVENQWEENSHQRNSRNGSNTHGVILINPLISNLVGLKVLSLGGHRLKTLRFLPEGEGLSSLEALNLSTRRPTLWDKHNKYYNDRAFDKSHYEKNNSYEEFDWKVEDFKQFPNLVLLNLTAHNIENRRGPNKIQDLPPSTIMKILSLKDKRDFKIVVDDHTKNELSTSNLQTVDSLGNQ